MPSSTTKAANPFAGYEPAQLPTGPILIATDLSDESDAAFPLAQVLALRTRADVQIVSVLQPIAMPMYGFDSIPVSPTTDATTRQGRTDAANAQQARLVVTDHVWPVMIRTGDAAQEVTEIARTMQSRVIVVGRGRHGALQRLLGGETVLRLLQSGDTPVLATETGMTHLPRRVVIATDFSPFSLFAAQIALSIVARDATIILAHMAPWFEKSEDPTVDRTVAYREEAKQGFAALRAHVARPDLIIEEALLEGQGTNHLIAFLTTANADLVVSATHGYGFVRRMVLGSVAATLVREAPCSVLCVPGSAQTIAAARGRTMANATTRRLLPERFDAELRAFSERNSGRPCTVEINQPELGAQRLGHGLPLVGASYDRVGDTVALMFGASQLTGQHLTHSIAAVSLIELATNGEGHDQVLRIGHGNGYTLLMLE